ncbi:helix-turn-helix domain-containing protein [Micromonospora chokoriensis]|uniref:Transcriptional regulator, XRE family with cupin sensor n=1 Tax=Micromonospora chokoriensis TaxID=356851 RepID=A0A1C4XMX1_9ACTN|nr:helix-turn-helix domain-containing protein [Micromonospora chokoriensis]SCF09726.1 transcriptional regulator, XRE family with cupin sensor [Micromonospora chokoriensis]
MLGDRLRDLRQQHSLTLRQLATAADVSPALLSQIENGATDPSLATLRKLAQVFDTSIAELFSEPEAPPVHISRVGSRTRLAAPPGQITYERLTPGRGDLEVLQAHLAPGDASSAEPWAHPSTECAIVVTGEVVAQIGAESYTLTAGESVTFDSRLAHLYRNASGEHAHLIIAVTPPTP